jgi:pimeloyl-ACP methyl ester carboxylesterase
MADELDLQVTSGRLHAIGRGPRSGDLILCLPGLTANARGFDLICGRLSAAGLRAVALDLRGRGRSEITAPGTYGWSAHARDVLEVATHLGAAHFNLVGWSMGAFVAMESARLAPERLARIALIDACGRPPADALSLIRLAVDRLGTSYPSIEDYLTRLRSIGTITPWHTLWEEYFRYELVATADGVRARTSAEAVVEDLAYGDAHDPRTLWPALHMPVLLMRAARPLVPDGPWIVTAEDRDAFQRSVPGGSVMEIDANHYGIVTHPAAAEAMVAFFTEGSPLATKV